MTENGISVWISIAAFGLRSLWYVISLVSEPTHRARA